MLCKYYKDSDGDLYDLLDYVILKGATFKAKTNCGDLYFDKLFQFYLGNNLKNIVQLLIEKGDADVIQQKKKMS